MSSLVWTRRLGRASAVVVIVVIFALACSNVPREPEPWELSSSQYVGTTKRCGKWAVIFVRSARIAILGPCLDYKAIGEGQVFSFDGQRGPRQGGQGISLIARKPHLQAYILLHMY